MGDPYPLDSYVDLNHLPTRFLAAWIACWVLFALFSIWSLRRQRPDNFSFRSAVLTTTGLLCLAWATFMMVRQ